MRSSDAESLVASRKPSLAVAWSVGHPFSATGRSYADVYIHPSICPAVHECVHDASRLRALDGTSISKPSILHNAEQGFLAREALFANVPLGIPF